MKSFANLFLSILVILALGMFVFACERGGNEGGNNISDDDLDDDSGLDDDAVDDDSEMDDDSIDDDSAIDDDLADDDSPTDDDSATDDDSTTDDDSGPDDDSGDDDTSHQTTEGFVFIPHGSFSMGSPENELGRRDNEVQHSVTLTHDFEMMEKETTQGKFEELMNYNPSRYPVAGSDPELPVEQTSWFDALAFSIKMSEALSYNACYTLSEIKCRDGESGDTTTYCKDHGGILDAQVALNGVTSVYDCEGFRLPTESEWEYAARAGTTTPFYNGNITNTACSPLDPKLDSIAWYCGNDNTTTHRVGGKTANSWGLYDVIGNVLEWCWDWYKKDYPDSAIDPIGPDSGVFRIVRGGAFRYSGADRCRSAYRAAQTPGFSSPYIGIRLVRTYPNSQGLNSPNLIPSFTSLENRLNRVKGNRDYPNELPFTFTREDVGVPLTPEEITAFTQKITGFYKNSNYFHWLLWVSHGMSETNPDEMPPYKLFYGDVSLVKTDDVVTFTHTGFDDNLTIPTSKIINNTAAEYLLSGDAAMGRLIEQYCKGIVALFRGMLWGGEDPEHTILARAIFPPDNSYVEEGRQANVEYGPVRHEAYDWNAHTIPNLINPDYGSIWVRNMRSKDDVPHIYRTVPMLMRVVEDGQDENVRDAAALALQYLQGFAKDVTDSGYFIRTKEGGDQLVPVNQYGFVVDLASFVTYTWLVPNSECSGRFTSALIGYGNPLDVDCGNGIGWIYELIATNGHYYNYDIVRYFHVASITNALMNWQTDMAYNLLEGMVTRVEYMLYQDPNRTKFAEFIPDAASYLLAAATAGLPLTSYEARLVMDEYTKAMDLYSTWEYWDPWASSVPNGGVPLTPSRWQSPTEPVIDWQEILYPFEYCYSPFRNVTTAPLLDCAVVADPLQWGE